MSIFFNFPEGLNLREGTIVVLSKCRYEKNSTRIGDVFVVTLDEHHKKYLQYIAANDWSDLGSDVVRAFEKLYAMNEDPSLSEIVRGEIQFYAHCVGEGGIKLWILQKKWECFL